MSKTHRWRQEYKSLGDFIAVHPEIAISASEVSIPQTVREEFYHRFDGVRMALVDEHYSKLPPEIGILSENYLQMEEEITRLLGLSSIAMPVDLFSFLHNPKDGLARVLYNKMFDLLQGKTTVEAFEAQAANDLSTAAEELYRLGYESWAALVVIKLLDPDQAFLVDLDDEYKPFLRELENISFGRQAHHPTMRIPEFVLHSRKIDKYVAVKMVLAREIETFVVPFKPPVRPRKKTGDTSSALASRVMLLSFMDSANEIPIIADIYERTITSPDWMIEFITESELKNPDSLGMVKEHLDALRPALGACLVLIGNKPEAMPETIPADVRTVVAGFDHSELLTAIDELPLKA